MVCVCTFVSSYLATKANNKLLKVCGLLESRAANWGAFGHDAPHILYYIYLNVSRTCTQGVQYNECL